MYLDEEDERFFGFAKGSAWMEAKTGVHSGPFGSLIGHDVRRSELVFDRQHRPSISHFLGCCRAKATRRTS